MMREWAAIVAGRLVAATSRGLRLGGGTTPPRRAPPPPARRALSAMPGDSTLVYNVDDPLVADVGRAYGGRRIGFGLDEAPAGGHDRQGPPPPGAARHRPPGGPGGGVLLLAPR